MLDIRYIAGLVDGEGHIGVRWERSAATGKWHIAPGLGVSSTDPWVLVQIMRVLGGSVHTDRRANPEQYKRRTGYKWRVQSRPEIVRALTLLYPHLYIKKEVAYIVLQELIQYEGPTFHPGISTVVQSQQRYQDGRVGRLVWLRV